MGAQSRADNIETASRLFQFAVGMAYGVTAMMLFIEPEDHMLLRGLALFGIGVIAGRGVRELADRHDSVIDREKRKSKGSPVSWGSLAGWALLMILLAMPVGFISFFTPSAVRNK